MPIVTVLMPAYNVGKYIEEAIDSVLKQTLEDFVLLVVDDCSTDNTAEVVKSFQDKRIRYEKNEHNLGLADNLNRGIELSDTEFVARMDGDDIAEPFWLEKEYNILLKHPDIDICGAGFQFFGTKKSVVRYPQNHEDIKVQMLFGCPVIVPMFRRKSIVDNGFRYKTSAFPAEDYMMWIECVQKLKFYNIRETLFYYRMHESQISTSKALAQKHKSDEARLVLLNRLSTKFTEDEKQYFLNKFIIGDIENIESVKKMHTFADELLLRNATSNYFNSKALKKKLDFHISLSVYYFVVAKYFINGYSLISLIELMYSEYKTDLPKDKLIKIFAKSLLGRKS